MVKLNNNLISVLNFVKLKFFNSIEELKNKIKV